MSKIVFGFDVGTGSLGEAVRKDNEITHAESMLMDSDVASIKEKSDNQSRAVRVVSEGIEV